MLPIVQVPEHGLGVLAARSTQRTVRTHGDSVQVACMADVVGLQLAVGQIPDLDVFVPTSGDDDGILIVGREPDARHPVLMSVLLDGVFTLCQGVPELDGFVPSCGNDLSVVCRESHGEDVLGVVLEPTSGLPSGEIPQTEGLVPRSRQSEMAIRRQNHIRDEVSMSMKPLLWDSVVAHVIPGKLPYNKRLVSGRRQDHVRILGIGCDLCDPTIVTP